MEHEDGVAGSSRGGGGTYVHPTAAVEPGAVVGRGTKIWSHVQIRSGARVGSDCIFGRNSFVDRHVTVGDRVKVQNNASLYEGVELEAGVFIGPHVVFTNDRIPRAVRPDGALKSSDDWELTRTIVREGASLGAGVVVVTGVTIGRWALIGSGSVVTRDVPDHALAVGNPARHIGWVSAGGTRCESQEAAAALTRREAEGPPRVA
jgi:acetyltransferase-like isoleucine patch superfamily enzyme